MAKDDIEIMDYLIILKKNWLWAFIGFILVFCAVLAYTDMSDSVYEAKSLVLITNQDQANFLLGSSSPKIADLETQKLIIQSYNIMYPTYVKFGENTFTLSVNTLKNTNIIEIGIEANSPENAATIANDVATNYVKYTSDTRKQDATGTIDFVTEKIKSYDLEIYVLEAKIFDFENRSKNLTRDEQITYQSVQRDIAAKKKIYEYLLTKREEAGITASIENANVKIISYAEIPLAPIRPNIPLNLALGFILAIGAAMGCALIANSIKERY
jgi:uncharacterized protein involved in exopolysaccharide biosynthesis